MKDKGIITTYIIQLSAILIGMGALISAPDARTHQNVMDGLGFMFMACMCLTVLCWVVRMVLKYFA